MNVAFGIKAHSGWAALVALGMRDGELLMVDRRRVDLVADPSSMWSKQPYHAAEHLAPDEARRLITREIDSARRIAVCEMRAALMRAQDAQQRIVGCAVLVGEPMPNWTVDEILAVHFRMHKAEGVLFRDVLVHAVEACGVPLMPIVEKVLDEHAHRALGASAARQIERIAGLKKTVGAPWGKDQRDAALAALVALQGQG